MNDYLESIAPGPVDPEFPPTPGEFACAGCPALDLVCAGPRLRQAIPEVLAS